MNTKSLWIAVVLVGALLLAGCRTQAAPAPIVPEGAQAGDLVGWAACEYKPALGQGTFAAECGTLVVPENWDEIGSRLIALPVVRVPARGPAPAEPVFFLQGGPGQSNHSWAPPDWLLEQHAVVLVGYRGIDGTVSLTCPGFSQRLKAHLGQDVFSAAARAEYAAAVRQCAADHQAAGTDLAGYTIPGVIADMEAARRALGYDRINLLSESYGTRVAQLYAYLHPGSLQRVILIAVNTPGRFVDNPAELDQLLQQVSALCAQDAACRSRTADLAQTMYAVNHSMPERWLMFPIDAGTVRLGAHFQLMSNANMAVVFDAYLAAAEGDPSGLAMANLMTRLLVPVDQFIWGDTFSKGGSTDGAHYSGLDSVSLGDSIMGGPMAELGWPMVENWPAELIAGELREFQASEVEMLLVNGSMDFATPPTALDAARPYYHRAQMVLLPGFSHTDDVFTLQPAAFERLVTSYYATGEADASLYVDQPLSFEPGLSFTTMAKALAAILIGLPALLLLAGGWLAVRLRQRRTLRRAKVAGVAVVGRLS